MKIILENIRSTTNTIMTKDIFVCFKQKFTLSPKIPLIELPTEIPKLDSISIEYITDKNYLTGFIIILEKELKRAEGEKVLDGFVKFFTHLICIKSNRHITSNPSGINYVRKDGTLEIGDDLSIVYNIEGAPVKLNIQDDLIRISKSSKPHIKQHIGYLAKTIILHQEKFPDHSIIEAFKIIENNQNFKNYNMYFALRNILAHSPYYKDKTMYYFKGSFNKDDFDYLKYESENNLIVLDLDSAKTLKNLNKIAIELINHLRVYLNIDK